ncbi:MAG: M16 family metallopeptidase [Planctomycetota bacterium]
MPATFRPCFALLLLLAGCGATQSGAHEVKAAGPAADSPAESLAAQALLHAQAAAEAARLPVRRGEGRLPFEEVVLENGLRVISLEDKSAPIVAVQLWYHVGSKDEQPDRQGFAHMFEHMMFRGTDRLGPKDHFDFVRRTGGDCNAFTSFDQTVYVQELPSNQLELVLWLEAERMSALRIDEGGFATERKVVEEERRLGLNQPFGDVLEKLLASLFTQHPYRWSPIGQIEHLRASTPDDIQRFWDTYYVPNNATLVVAGDASHADVRALAQKCFGWIPRCPDPPRVTLAEPEQTALAQVKIEPANGPVPIAGLAFRAVPEGHPDAVALELLMTALGGGESSRVYIDLVRRKDLAVAGLGLYAGLEQAGFAAVVGVLMPQGRTDPVLAALWEQIDLVCESGLTAEELAKVRKQMLRDDVTQSLTVASKANALGQAATIFGDAQEANERLRRLESVTLEDLTRVARTYLVRERATEVRIEPGLGSMMRGALSAAASLNEKSEESESGEEVAGGRRASASGPKAGARPPRGYPTAPPVAPPLALELALHGVETRLDNGLGLVVVENHEVPFVSLSLRLETGAFTEDQSLPGTAAMAASMVTRGTVARDAEALALELEKNGISLSASADQDSAAVNVSALTGDVEQALRLLAEVVLAPRFDPKEFETLRKQTSTGMAVSEKTPSVQAERALATAIWGAHPYGRPAEGVSADLKRLTPLALRDWWERWVRPDTATLYVAGDVSAERAQALAQRFLGGWDAEGEPPVPPLPATEAQPGTRITLVDSPGAVQSEIRAGHFGVTREHPLYATGAVLSQVFGGAFTSRLNDSLRVEKGLTYGASGGLSSDRFGGEFRVSTFTKTPTTAETVRAVLDEVRRMRDLAPSSEELNAAKSYLLGSFAGSLETPQAAAARLWTLRLHGLPADWWDGYLQRIAGTGAEDVAAAARTLLDPERLHIVVVGDAAVVRESLEAIAPVTVVTIGG